MVAGKALGSVPVSRVAGRNTALIVIAKVKGCAGPYTSATATGSLQVQAIDFSQLLTL